MAKTQNFDTHLSDHQAVLSSDKQSATLNIWKSDTKAFGGDKPKETPDQVKTRLTQLAENLVKMIIENPDLKIIGLQEVPTDPKEFGIFKNAFNEAQKKQKLAWELIEPKKMGDKSFGNATLYDSNKLQRTNSAAALHKDHPRVLISDFKVRDKEEFLLHFNVHREHNEAEDAFKKDLAKYAEDCFTWKAGEDNSHFIISGDFNHPITTASDNKKKKFTVTVDGAAQELFVCAPSDAKSIDYFLTDQPIDGEAIKLSKVTERNKSTIEALNILSPDCIGRIDAAMATGRLLLKAGEPGEDGAKTYKIMERGQVPGAEPKENGSVISLKGNKATLICKDEKNYKSDMRIMLNTLLEGIGAPKKLVLQKIDASPEHKKIIQELINEPALKNRISYDETKQLTNSNGVKLEAIDKTKVDEGNAPKIKKDEDEDSDERENSNDPGLNITLHN